MNDKSLTTWQEMSGIDRDRLTAKPIVAAVVALAYGIYKFVALGTSVQHSLYTYVVTAGAVASIICIFWYSLDASLPRKGSFTGMLASLSGFIPYLFAIYLMAVLGCYGIWSSVDPLSIFGIAVGIIWILLGHYMLRTFWIITELAVHRAEKAQT